LIDFFINLITTHGPLIAYGLLFISAFVENIFPPIPGDTVTLFGAYLVGRGQLAFLPVFIATVSGSFASFMIIYYLGLKKGRGFFTRSDSSLRSVRHLEKVERWFQRYGPKVILANRFLSGVRSVIALAAGLGNMPARKVAVYSLVSIVVWNGLILTAGLFVGANWQVVKTILGAYSRIILVLVLVIIISLVVKYIFVRQHSS
jgi:membrane protein DedA with SNARE-associated domain